MLKHIFNSRYTVVILGDRGGEKERDRDVEERDKRGGAEMSRLLRTISKVSVT